jgi:hypothetical protein
VLREGNDVVRKWGHKQSTGEENSANTYTAIVCKGIPKALVSQEENVLYI